MICYPKLNSKIIKGEIEDEIKDSVEIVKDWRLSLSRKKNREDK